MTCKYLLPIKHVVPTYRPFNTGRIFKSNKTKSSGPSGGVIIHHSCVGYLPVDSKVFFKHVWRGLAANTPDEYLTKGD